MLLSAGKSEGSVWMWDTRASLFNWRKIETESFCPHFHFKRSAAGKVVFWQEPQSSLSKHMKGGCYNPKNDPSTKPSRCLVMCSSSDTVNALRITLPAGDSTNLIIPWIVVMLLTKQIAANRIKEPNQRNMNNCRIMLRHEHIKICTYAKVNQCHFPQIFNLL